MPLRIELVWAFRGFQQAMNVLHATGDYGQANALAMAEDLSDAFDNSDMKQYVGNEWDLRHVEVKNAEDTSQAQTFTGQVTGTGTGDALPKYCTLAVRLGTVGTAPNGRIYLPGWDEDASTASGRPQGLRVQAAIDFAEDLRQAILNATGTYVMAVYSRTLDDYFSVLNVDRSQSSTNWGWQTQRGRRRAIVFE